MKQNVPIALALRGVSKRFDRPAVDALDLTVYGGEFYVFVGPNGRRQDDHLAYGRRIAAPGCRSHLHRRRRRAR